LAIKNLIDHYNRYKEVLPEFAEQLVNRLNGS
jgi:hypothetical protein